MAIAYNNAAGAPILMIGGNDANFHDRVTRSLDKIGQTIAGAALLAGIQTNRVNGSNVGIVTGLGSQCACVTAMSHVSRTLLAQAVLDHHIPFPAELNACMMQLGHQNDFQWMADEINNTPVYDIQGAPSVAPSNLGVTAQHVDDWVNGVHAFPHPFVAPNVDRLERALLTALWPAAQIRRGTGGHSRVSWNSGSGSIGLTNGAAQVRSKTIGLAHELIHAYYNGMGQQMGFDNPLADVHGNPTVTSTALFEYQCVGLGIWAGEPISENAIRGQWHTVVSYTLFGGRTSIHYGTTEARPCY